MDHEGLLSNSKGHNSSPYLQDVALLYGSVLQLTGFLLQTESGATDGKTGDHLLWNSESALTFLHGLHLLLEVLHVQQQTLKKTFHCSDVSRAFIAQ